ncbi:sigma factor-like helix-turn-helix DNA-binding protein [Ornithinimicrobium sp. Y1694]|uniref:sigma factor-like helix-turn-helix DNA-binding protein n=1 Tax=Ornithinimicrobium sp. Y1694 TaxID=3418590 RepID=UPI003CF296A4
MPHAGDSSGLAEFVAHRDLLFTVATLGPVERAVFVLREVFDFPHAEVAEALDRTPAAVRQISHRARRRVREQRDVTELADTEASLLMKNTAHRAVVERFRSAVNTGDLQSLMDVLAPDVVLLTDGGGKVKAALRRIVGAEKVLRFLAGVSFPGVVIAPTVINGEPGMDVLVDGERLAAATVLLREGLVQELYLVRNPDKLAQGDARVTLRRT